MQLLTTEYLYIIEIQQSLPTWTSTTGPVLVKSLNRASNCESNVKQAYIIEVNK